MWCSNHLRTGSYFTCSSSGSALPAKVSCSIFSYFTCCLGETSVPCARGHLSSTYCTSPNTSTHKIITICLRCSWSYLRTCFISTSSVIIVTCCSTTSSCCITYIRSHRIRRTWTRSINTCRVASKSAKRRELHAIRMRSGCSDITASTLAARVFSCALLWITIILIANTFSSWIICAI